MSLLNSIVISGIFGKKEEDLDILPPPPPFPQIGEKEKDLIESEKRRKAEEKRQKELKRLRLKEEKRKHEQLERKKLEKIRADGEKRKQKELERRNLEEQRRKAQEERTRQKELEKKRRYEEKKRSEEERRRKEQEKKKRQEGIERKNKKLMERRAKTAKKKTFDFLNKVGLAKTEKEKTEHHRQRKEYTELRKNAEKMLEEEARRMELEREKLAKIGEKEAKKKKDSGIGAKPEIKQIERAERTEFEEKPAFEKEKMSIFGKIFMRKDEELEKGLEELDKIGMGPLETIKELKIPEPEELEKETLEAIEKPREIVRAEEEIQKAIDGIKKKSKRPSIIKKFFERKEEEKLETPEVMPSFEERADEVGLIEEKIHKARMALMDFKFDMAKKAYIDIMRVYNGMDSKKKARVYPDIKDLYYERKAAEKYAK